MEIKKPEWQVILQDAVQETEPRRAEAKIHAAELAIFNRIGDTRPGPGFAEEQQLFEALSTIRMLKSLHRSPAG